MATPRIGRRDLIARVTTARAPLLLDGQPRTAGEAKIRGEALARALAQLTHLVPLVGRRLARADARRDRLNAIQDQAVALCHELARLAADVGGGGAR